MIVKVKVLFAWSCLTLCDPMGRDPPWSSIHENFQARILDWISIPFRGSFQPRNRTWVCCPEGRFCTLWAIREVQYLPSTIVIFVQDSYHCLIKWNIKIYGTTEMEAFCKFWINDYHYCCLSLSWKIFYLGPIVSSVGKKKLCWLCYCLASASVAWSRKTERSMDSESPGWDQVLQLANEVVSEKSHLWIKRRRRLVKAAAPCKDVLGRDLQNWPWDLEEFCEQRWGTSRNTERTSV